MKRTIGVLIVLCSSVDVVASQLQLPALNERLMAAVLANDAAAVVTLLQQGARADGLGARPDGLTPLMAAASASHDRPSPMKEAGIPANSGGPDLKRDDLPVMKLLLEYGAEVNARDAFGKTALWWAAVWAGKLPNTTFLLAHHADADANDKDGESVLFDAVRAPRSKGLKSFRCCSRPERIRTPPTASRGPR